MDRKVCIKMEFEMPVLYSIIVPVYNSEQSIPILYKQLVEVFHEMDKNFEIIFIDDSSKDHSYEVMKELYCNNSNVKIVQLSKNFGQHKAIICGLSFADGEFIITMDDDLQHPPAEIPKMINAIQNHPEIDVVIGSYDTKKHNFIRNLGTYAMNFVSSYIFKRDSKIKLTSFRLMRRFVAQALLDADTVTPRIGSMILQVTNRIMNVKIHHEQRIYGHSGYPFRQLMKDFLNNILNNSDLPLKLVGKIGIVSFICSITMILYYIILYFVRGISIQGWTTLVILILLFFGITLFSVGLIGSYMIRIMAEAKKMPLYVVRDAKTDGNGRNCT